MSATARCRQARTTTEEMSVVNPSSLSIPLDQSSLQKPSEQSTETVTDDVTNEKLVTESKISECTNEKSSNKSGMMVAVIAGSVSVCLSYFYFFI